MSADDPFGDLPGVEPIYNSYAVDPVFARKFTYAWVGALGGCIVLSLPFVLRSTWHRGFSWSWLLGLREDWSPADTVSDEKAKVSSHKRRRRTQLDGVLYSLLFSPYRFTIPFLELNIGQLVVLAAYLFSLILCITTDAQLLTNSNRAGFIALAQLPPLFLFATKNSVLCLLLGPGASYDRLNWLHKNLGRGLFIAAAIHGSLWIRDRLMYDNPILGEQKETSGIAAFGTLGCIILLTVRPFRQRFYQAFFALHILTFPAFFITICVHTPYAAPWIYPPLALYGFDLLLRLLRLRVKDATLTAPDNQMTIITVHDAHTGFSAGQHVRLRVFAKGRVVFESHPLTILCAPTKTTVLSPAVVQPGSLVLAARACGDWSRALNDIARADSSSDPLICEDTPLLNPTDGVPVQVMLDGPYGGPSVDLGDSEHVLLLAGGSGITFALGMLDDILGRVVRHGRKGGERTRRIELAWCIRSFGAMGWVVPHFRTFAEAAKRDSNLELRFTVFVTCLCDPEAVPDIEGLEVTIERPVPGRMLKRFIRNERLVGCGCEVDSSQEEAEKEGFELGSEKGAGVVASTTADVGVLEKGGELTGEVVTGCVAMCVAGPESLVREAANAAGRLGAGEESRMGGLSLHCEVYAM